MYLKIWTGTSPSTIIENYVSYDPSKITMSIKNEHGRPIRQLTGDLLIHGTDYDYFFTTINAGTYFNESYCKAYLYNNAVLIAETNNIKLVKNDTFLKQATFQLYNEILDNYNLIYRAWEKEYDIVDVTPVPNITFYDHRSNLTKITYDPYRTFYCLKDSFGVWIADVASYIATKQADPEWTLNQIEFTYADGVCSGEILSLDVKMDWVQLVAYGFYNGSTKVPPAGIDWVYKDDVILSGITYPRFSKKTNTLDEIRGDLELGKDCAYIFGVLTKGLYYYASYYWPVPTDFSISYLNAGRKVTDVIEYLMDKVNSSVSFDVNSFYSFNNYEGETYGAYGKLCYKNLILMGMSDMIPDTDNTQKSIVQSKFKITLKGLLDWFVERGFYWYLEDIGGTFYFRLWMVMDKTLTSGNPDVTNLKGKDWSKRGEFNIQPPEWETISNETQSSTFDFTISQLSAYYTDVSPLNKSISDTNIYTDINYIVDAKESIFSSDIDQFAMLSTSYDGSTYQVRRVATGDYTYLATNNIELSLPYIFLYVMADLPQLSTQGSVFATANRLAKRKKLQISVPIENFYTDFDFFKYVDIGVTEYEIEEITMKLSETVATLNLMKV